MLTSTKVTVNLIRVSLVCEVHKNDPNNIKLFDDKFDDKLYGF